MDSVIQTILAAQRGDRQALNQLQEFRQSDGYFSAIAGILNNDSVALHCQLAAYEIKVNIANPRCNTNGDVQQNVLLGLGNPSMDIQKAMASVISDAVRREIWPFDLVDVLGAKIADPALTSGVTLCLSQIVEDNAQILDGLGKTAPLASLMAPLVAHSDKRIRLNALIAVNIFLEAAGIDVAGATYAALAPYAVPLVNAVLSLMEQRQDSIVLIQCVKCVTMALTYHELVANQFDATASCMMSISAAHSVDDDVRAGAIEFWRAVLYFPHFEQRVFPLMRQIIPILCRCMVYSDMELGMLSAKENDSNVPDRQQDIKPRHYQGKRRDIQQDGEEEDGDDDEVEDYNLRRVAALTLDEISQHFGDKILGEVLSSIDEMMNPSRPWKELEAAILAVGAIAEGCYNGLQEYLPQIATRLLDIIDTNSTHFLVRSICCWTLQMVSPFALCDGNEPYLMRTLQSILCCMKSSSKYLQEAAAAALGEVANRSVDGQLKGYKKPILEVVSDCFQYYQLKNRLLLFETVETLCRVFDTDLANDDDCVKYLLGPLGVIWGETPNDSPLIFSLFSCMSSVCGSVGRHIHDMAPAIFGRGWQMVKLHVEMRQQALAQNAEPPEQEFLVTSWVLISGLFDAVGSSLEPLIEEPLFTNVLLTCFMDEDHAIRQSAFAVAADMAKHCPAHVQRCLPDVLHCVLKNLEDINEQLAPVVSNVAFFVGELVANQIDMNNLSTLGVKELTVVSPALLRAVTAFQLSSTERNMAENVCLSLGRILMVDLDTVSKIPNFDFNSFSYRYCEYIRNVKNSPQKEEATRGYMGALQAVPHMASSHLPLLLDLIYSLGESIPSDLKSGIRALLNNYKTGVNWRNAVQQCRKEQRDILHSWYGLYVA